MGLVNVLHQLVVMKHNLHFASITGTAGSFSSAGKLAEGVRPLRLARDGDDKQIGSAAGGLTDVLPCGDAESCHVFASLAPRVILTTI